MDVRRDLFSVSKTSRSFSSIGLCSDDDLMGLVNFVKINCTWVFSWFVSCFYQVIYVSWGISGCAPLGLFVLGCSPPPVSNPIRHLSFFVNELNLVGSLSVQM